MPLLNVSLHAIRNSQIICVQKNQAFAREEVTGIFVLDKNTHPHTQVIKEFKTKKFQPKYLYWLIDLNTRPRTNNIWLHTYCAKWMVKQIHLWLFAASNCLVLIAVTFRKYNRKHLHESSFHRGLRSLSSTTGIDMRVHSGTQVS